MSQAVSKYHELYESLLSRRSKPVLPTGLDRVYGRLAMKLRNRKVSPEYLRAEAEASDRIHATEIRELSEQSLADQIATVRAAAEECLWGVLGLWHSCVRRGDGRGWGV